MAAEKLCRESSYAAWHYATEVNDANQAQTKLAEQRQKLVSEKLQQVAMRFNVTQLRDPLLRRQIRILQQAKNVGGLNSQEEAHLASSMADMKLIYDTASVCEDHTFDPAQDLSGFDVGADSNEADCVGRVIKTYGEW